MKQLLIIGAGGHGRVVADIASLSKQYSCISFVDDAKIKERSFPVLGSTQNIESWIEESEIIVAIGDNVTRKNQMNILAKKGALFATLIHPSAIIANDVVIGKGSVVMANAVINCGSQIGEGVIINTAATIDHDNIIGDFVHISPGAHLAGTVQVGDITWIGIGATISNNLSICSECVIGAGAVVINNIQQKCIAIGVPAKPVKFIE